MNKPLSIIVPAYNEESRIGDSIRRILNYVTEQTIDAELIVVDDGSTDSTTVVAKTACAEFTYIRTNVIRYDENRGKGFAVKTGLISAENEIALFSDADLSTPIDELPKLIDAIENEQIDVVFGSRALDRELIGNHQPWRREQGGRVFNWFVQKLTNLPYWDTQCGFKAFNMNAFRPLLDKMTIDRFGFDVEFLFVAYHAELKLKEIPVIWNHCDGTKVRIFRDSFRMFSEIRQIRKNSKRGFYSE